MGLFFWRFEMINFKLVILFIIAMGLVAVPASSYEEKPLPENPTWSVRLKKFSKYQDDKLQEYHQKAVEDMKVSAGKANMVLENKLAEVIAAQAKIDKSKLTLKEEEALNAKIKVENEMMKKEILGQKEVFDDLIQHFKLTGLLKNLGSNKNIDKNQLGLAAILIDDYAAYDYKRILHWQFFVQTLLDLNEIGNKTRNKELYNSTGDALKIAYDIERTVVNETMQGASAYSLLDKGTKIEVLEVLGLSSQSYGTALVTQREKAFLRYNFSGKEVENRIPLLILYPEKNKTVFNFAWQAENQGRFHTEIHGFEKDLQNLRSTVIPVFFDNLYIPQITDRPITKRQLPEFDGIYAITSYTKNGKSISEDELSKMKAVFSNGITPKLIIQNGAKDTNYQFKIDPTNKLIDITNETESVIPSLGLYETKDNQIQINFSSPGKLRPLHLSVKPATDLTILEFRRMLRPTVEFKVISPMKDLVLGDNIVINAQLTDPENGVSHIEYRFGKDQKWTVVKPEPNNKSTVKIEIETFSLGDQTFEIRGFSERGGYSDIESKMFSIKPPTVDFKVISPTSPLRDPVLGETIKISVKYSDTGNVPCQMEYRFGYFRSNDQKWTAVKPDPDNKSTAKIEIETVSLGDHTFEARGFTEKAGYFQLDKKKFNIGIPLNWTGNSVISVGTSGKQFAGFKTKMNLIRSEDTNQSFISRGPSLNYKGEFVFISKSDQKEYPYYIQLCVDKFPNSNWNYNYLMKVSLKNGVKTDYKTGASLPYWCEFKGEIDGTKSKISGKETFYKDLKEKSSLEMSWLKEAKEAKEAKEPIPPNDINECYGVVAISQKTGRWGYCSAHQKDKQEAANHALSSCNAHDAKVVLCVKNQWFALASGGGGAFGWSHGSDPDEVRKRAIKECLRFSNTAKIVVLNHSNNKNHLNQNSNSNSINPSWDNSDDSKLAIKKDH